MKVVKSRIGAVAVGATIIAFVGGGSAVASGQFSSAQVKDQAVRSAGTATNGHSDGHADDQGNNKDNGKHNGDKQGGIGNILHNSAATPVAHDDGNFTDVTVQCPAPGYVATGGGFSVDGGGGDRNQIHVSESRNTIDGKGWLLRAYNNGTTPQDVRSWVVCVYAPKDNPAD